MFTAPIVRLQTALAERQGERGAAMAEYGLLLALVALAAIVVLSLFGNNIKNVFTTANNSLTNGLANAGGGTTGSTT